jgi:histone deacetylase complex subunit SAP18
VATHIPEYRHPLARFSFKAIYADSASRGRFSQKDLGTVYSRDILGEPGTLDATAPRLVDEEPVFTEERTLEELRFVPGDYLCVAVLLPKGVSTSNDAPFKGGANGWKSGLASLRSDGGWGTTSVSGGGGAGRGGGHWRGDSNPHLGRGRASGRMGGDRGIERPHERPTDIDRRNVGRHDTPPRSSRGGHRRSPTRSRSPPKRRR